MRLKKIKNFIQKKETPHTKEWKKLAKLLTLDACKRQTQDWYHYDNTQTAALEQAILGNLFRMDEEGARKANISNSIHFGYSKEQKKYATKVRMIFQSIGGDVSVDMQVVFRVRNSKNGAQYVDHDGRIYKTWDGYLKKNKLDKGMMCYPKSGYLRDGTQVGFKKPPSCTVAAKVDSAVKTTLSVVTVAATATLAVGSFFTFGPAGIIVMNAATGASAVAAAFNVIRQGLDVHDKVTHGQSAASEIFNIVTIIVAEIATRGFKWYANKMAKATGRALSGIERIFGTLAIIGVKSMVVCNFLQLLFTIANKETLSALDILNFVLSCHQMYGIVMSPWTAQGYVNKAKAELAAQKSTEPSKEQTQNQETETSKGSPTTKQSEKNPGQNTECTSQETGKPDGIKDSEAGKGETTILKKVGKTVGGIAYKKIRELCSKKESQCNEDEGSPGPQGAHSTTENSNQTDDQSAEQQERITLEREIGKLYSRHRAMPSDNPERETLAEELRIKDKKRADMDFERILRENAGMKDDAYKELEKFIDTRTATEQLNSKTSGRYVQAIQDMDAPSVFEIILETKTKISFFNGESTELLINDELVVHPKALKLLNRATDDGQNLMMFLFDTTKRFKEEDLGSADYPQKKQEYLTQIRKTLDPVRFLTQIEKQDFSNQLLPFIGSLSSSQQIELNNLSAGEIVQLRPAIEKISPTTPPFKAEDRAIILKMALSLDMLGNNGKIDGYILANKLKFVLFKLEEDITEWTKSYKSRNSLPKMDPPNDQIIDNWTSNFTKARDTFFRGDDIGLLKRNLTGTNLKDLKALYLTHVRNTGTCDDCRNEVFMDQNGQQLMNIEIQPGLRVVEKILKEDQQNQCTFTVWESSSGYFGVTRG